MEYEALNPEDQIKVAMMLGDTLWNSLGRNDSTSLAACCTMLVHLDNVCLTYAASMRLATLLEDDEGVRYNAVRSVLEMLQALLTAKRSESKPWGASREWLDAQALDLYQQAGVELPAQH